jgi:glutaredoxin
MTARPHVMFVTRQGCSICEALYERVSAHAARLGIEVTIVDVDTDPQLQERFSHTVPVVLRSDGKVLVAGRVSTPSLLVALMTAKRSAS